MFKSPITRSTGKLELMTVLERGLLIRCLEIHAYFLSIAWIRSHPSYRTDIPLKSSEKGWDRLGWLFIGVDESGKEKSSANIKLLLESVITKVRELLQASTNASPQDIQLYNVGTEANPKPVAGLKLSHPVFPTNKTVDSFKELIAV
jgi:hypothetical protein